MADDNQKPIHGQPALCEHILRSVSSSTVPLQIRPSLITNAGSGLFVLKDVPAGSEIFRSDPLLVVCDSGNKEICDYCLLNKNSSVHPDGRFFDAGERDKIEILACTRCKCAQYCSKVRSRKNSLGSFYRDTTTSDGERLTDKYFSSTRIAKRVPGSLTTSSSAPF